MRTIYRDYLTILLLTFSMIFIIKITEYFSIPLVIPPSFPNTIISRLKRGGNIEREPNNQYCKCCPNILIFQS